MVQRLWNLIMKRSALNSGVPMTWLASWNPIGERTNPTSPPGGRSLFQVNSPFSTLMSQIRGSKNPEVMASINGGQRLTVSPITELTALNACGGIALNQSGKPSAPGTGGGSSPSNSAGQRKVSVIESLCRDVTSGSTRCNKFDVIRLAASLEQNRAVLISSSCRAADAQRWVSDVPFRVLRRPVTSARIVI